jgi:hypothetical protein
MQTLSNIKAFLSGFAKGWHYTFVNHYDDKIYPFQAFWYDCGYGLSYCLTGWFTEYRDMYQQLKRG